MKPVLFNIPVPWDGAIPIRAYGFMVMLGFLAAIGVALWRAKRERAKGEVIWDLWMWALIAGFAGARLLYVMLFWPHFQGDLIRVFYVWEGGVAFQGGFIGALSAILIYLRIKRHPILRYLDIIAASVILGYAFARVGCFLNGCCHGKPTQLPWAVTYPAAAPMDAAGNLRWSPAYEAQSSETPPAPMPPWVLSHNYYGPRIINGHLHRLYSEERLQNDPDLPMPQCVPVHPTQIYASISALIIFFLLNLYYRMPRKEGQVAALFGILYTVYRFVNESFRGDQPKPYCGLTLFQLIAIGMFVGFAAFWLACRKWAPRYTPPQNARS